jgi:hypothetical protein
MTGLSSSGVGSLYPHETERRAETGDVDVNDAMAEHQTASLIGLEASAPPVNSLLTPGSECPGRRPPRDCGELPFVIKRDGTWLYRGSPIGRREMVCLFSSVLRREADGSYWLETPVERGRIEVEDTPWLAVEMDWKGCGRDQVLSFRTNVDQVVAAGPDHPIRVRTDVMTQEPTPYILVKGTPGLPPMEARITRAVYYELAALAVPGMHCGRNVLGVWSQNRFFALGDMPNCTDAEFDCPEA